MSQEPVTVTIVRVRDPLHGQRLKVLRRVRRDSGVELLVLLDDGSKRLVPAGWTDLDQPADVPDEAVAPSSGLTLGSVRDLLAACTVVAGLVTRAETATGTRQEQAARQSPTTEDHRAACPAQSAAGDLSGAIDRTPTDPVPRPAADAGRGVLDADRGADSAGTAADRAAGRGGRPDGPADRRGGHRRAGDGR